MSRTFVPPSPETVQAIHDLSERRLSEAEFNAYVDAPMSDDERREILDLIAWFERRYPRPLDRLVSARRAYARAVRRSPRQAG
jgi:hypothetical protein